MRVPVVLLSVCILTGLWLPSVHAQSASDAPGMPHELKGPELPSYFVVQGFFDQAISKRRNVESGAYLGLLQDLEIEPHGEAHQRLDQALDQAEDILAKPTVDPTINDEEEYWRFQMQALRVRAKDLGKVYGMLVRDLARSDKAVHLEHYIDYRIRPGTSIWLTDELPVDLLSVADEFDRGMAQVEPGEPHE